MKKLLALGFLTLMATAQAQAQVTPDIDLKGTTQSESLSLKFDLPQSLSGLSLNFSSPDSLKSFSLNFQPVLELVALLEGRGAKVQAKLVEIKNATVLELTVDGKKIDPIAIECNDCVIVFEY